MLWVALDLHDSCMNSGRNAICNIKGVLWLHVRC